MKDHELFEFELELEFELEFDELFELELEELLDEEFELELDEEFELEFEELFEDELELEFEDELPATSTPSLNAKPGGFTSPWPKVWLSAPVPGTPASAVPAMAATPSTAAEPIVVQQRVFRNCVI